MHRPLLSLALLFVLPLAAACQPPGKLAGDDTAATPLDMPSPSPLGAWTPPCAALSLTPDPVTMPADEYAEIQVAAGCATAVTASCDAPFVVELPGADLAAGDVLHIGTPGRPASGTYGCTLTAAEGATAFDVVVPE